MGIKLRRDWRTYAGLATGLVLILAFQNCQQIEYVPAKSVGAKPTDGTGTGNPLHVDPGTSLPSTGQPGEIPNQPATMTPVPVATPTPVATPVPTPVPTPTPVALSRPYSGTPFAIPGVIEAENYDLGGQGFAYVDNTAGNYFGNVYRSEDVDVNSCASIVGNCTNYYVGETPAGEFLQFTVNVASTRMYVVLVKGSAGLPTDRTFSIGVDSVDGTGVQNFPATGSWNNFQTVMVPMNLTAGRHTIRFVWESGHIALDSIEFK